MSNSNKAKGTRWEGAVRDFIRERGLDARRKVQRGTADEGDLEIRELEDVVLQAKDQGQLRLPQWMDDVRDQALAARCALGFLVIKRRQKGPGSAYVVCDLGTFCDMMTELVEGRQAIGVLEDLEGLADD